MHAATYVKALIVLAMAVSSLQPLLLLYEAAYRGEIASTRIDVSQVNESHVRITFTLLYKGDVGLHNVWVEIVSGNRMHYSIPLGVVDREHPARVEIVVPREELKNILQGTIVIRFRVGLAEVEALIEYSPPQGNSTNG